MNSKRLTKPASKIEVSDSEAHISASASSSECYRSHDNESDSLGSSDMTERSLDNYGYLVPKRRDNSKFGFFLFMENLRSVQMLFNRPADG